MHPSIQQPTSHQTAPSSSSILQYPCWSRHRRSIHRRHECADCSVSLAQKFRQLQCWADDCAIRGGSRGSISYYRVLNPDSFPVAHWFVCLAARRKRQFHSVLEHTASSTVTIPRTRQLLHLTLGASAHVLVLDDDAILAFSVSPGGNVVPCCRIP
jgi:hypothetical protein